MRVASLPPYMYKRSMSNINQMDGRNNVLDKRGKAWCGPVSVSNVLIYLARRHFQMLILPMGSLSKLASQVKLVETLAKYMKTNSRYGTDPIDMMEGLEKYVRERGYKTKIKWKGRFDGGSFHQGNKPDVDWIMRGAISTSNTILNIGGYKYNSKKFEYKRGEGHYLTVAGFKANNSELIVHDTAIGGSKGKNVCALSEIERGKFAKQYDDCLTRYAAGFFKISGIHIPNDAEIAIVDGALVFNVFRK